MVIALYVSFVAPLIATLFRYHWLPLALLEVSVTLPLAQNVVGPLGVIVGVGGIGFTVTLVAADGALAHPRLVTMTV